VAALIPQGIPEPVLETSEPPPLPINDVHQEGCQVSYVTNFMVERLRANADKK
jgi:hypothetical protein